MWMQEEQFTQLNVGYLVWTPPAAPAEHTPAVSSGRTCQSYADPLGEYQF